MDQFYQLQQQIQRLRQDINNITSMTSQLQQFEQNNASQLQRLQQNEVTASQQLQRIQQICGQISSDLNSVSSAAQQAGQSISQNPQLGSGISGYSQQFGSFGNQYAPSQATGSFGSSQHYQPNYIAGMPMQQQRFGSPYTGSYYSPMQSGYAQSYNQSFGSYATPGMMNAQDYGNQQSQSFAENQQISQMAQQSLANRLNQNSPGMSNQFSNLSGNYSSF